MNIGIFEQEHFETGYALIRLFDVPENSITIFTNDKSYLRFAEFLGNDIHRINWIIQKQNESHYAFIRRIDKYLNKKNIDLLFYSTISNNHLLHALLLQRHKAIRTILTIHAVNAMFEPIGGISVKNIARNLGKKMLVRQIKELNVISETIIAYLNSQLSRPKVIHNIPGSVFEKHAVCQNIYDRIRLVIPGTIDEKRRDYDKLFLLADLGEKNLLPIDITLLGEPYNDFGNEVINRIKSQPQNYVKIKYYETIVSQPEFDEQTGNAHFIFVPSVIKTKDKGITEIYGITKSSGSIHDAVRHAKPLIIPQRFALPDGMVKSSFRYSDVMEIIEFFQALFHDPQLYATWQENALENSLQYTVEKVKQRNPSLFTDFLKP